MAFFQTPEYFSARKELIHGNNAGLMERIFHLSESHTTVKTEIMAGITTFMTMAYILAVNPSIMSTTGMDKGAVLTATALAGFLGTMLMAVLPITPLPWHRAWGSTLSLPLP